MQVVLYNRVCIIHFLREFVYKYSGLEPTPLEKAESIDMPSVLAHGYKVHIVLFDLMTHSIDATEDLARDEALMHNDLSFRKYNLKVR